MTTETRPINCSSGVTFKAPCAKCRTQTLHSMSAGIERECVADDPDEEGFAIGFRSVLTYAVIECRGCESLSFRRDYWSTEDPYELPEHYPRLVTGRLKLQHVYFVPQPIRRIYEETYDAMCAELRVLSGVGIRASIEAVCKERGAQGNDLKKQITNLVSTGALTQDHANLLQKLRLFGNKAAHEVAAHSMLELGIAMDIVEHLLAHLYIHHKLI